MTVIYPDSDEEEIVPVQPDLREETVVVKGVNLFRPC